MTMTPASFGLLTGVVGIVFTLGLVVVGVVGLIRTSGRARVLLGSGMGVLLVGRALPALLAMAFAANAGVIDPLTGTLVVNVIGQVLGLLGILLLVLATIAALAQSRSSASDPVARPYPEQPGFGGYR